MYIYIYIYIYIHTHWYNRVFTNGSGDRGSILGQVMPKTQKKWYLIPPCLTLSIIWYRSKVGSSYYKGSFRLPSTGWLTYIYLKVCSCIVS